VRLSLASDLACLLLRAPSCCLESAIQRFEGAGATQGPCPGRPSHCAVDAAHENVTTEDFDDEEALEDVHEMDGTREGVRRIEAVDAVEALEDVREIN